MSGKRSSVRKSVRSTLSSRAADKAPEPTDHLAEQLSFLSKVQPGCKDDSVRDVVAVVQDATPIQELQVLKAGLEAIVRLCAPTASPAGFFAVLKHQGTETLAHVAAAGPEDSRPRANTALAALCQRAALWLDAVDAVDFAELPKVMDLGRTLALLPFGEGVAMSFLGAMERFALHRVENCVAIIDQDAIWLCHSLLAAHRAPEVCHEVLKVLYHVCDVPADMFAAPLKEEVSIIITVVETLGMAPLNMRLQIAGMRLLCLWNQPEEFEADVEFYVKEDRTILKDDLRKAMKEAGVPACLENTLGNLQRAGLTYQASWLSTLASNALSGRGLRPRVHLLEKKDPGA